MSSNNTMENSKNTDMLTRSYSDRSNDRNRDANSNRERDYDALKQQCDKAMHELMMLRRQHGETVRRYDQTRKELDYYRGQNQVMINQIEQATQESSSLRAKLAVEKQISDRSQQDIPEDDTASGDSLNDFISYDTRLEDFEALRKGYDNLSTTHAAAVDKINMMKDEINQLKKQCNELFKERDIALRERDGLKQQCTAAIRQWDLTLRERNDLQEAIKKVQLQHDEAVKEMNATVAYSVKSSKELKDLTKAHDAAVKEYRLIMSERDSVHNELEKLSEDLSAAYNKNKALEAEVKSCKEEIKTLHFHVESLKREISSALHDRDKALKECHDYQERFGEITAKNESQREFKSNLDYGFNRERENQNDSREQVASLDLYNSCQKERMDNLDQANQEIERLRKLADKYHAELDESLEEAEVSKRRRDWAFSERDKIVLERESIRTLCDSLRKQRDDAVSKLAHAMRDCDDVTKQKSDYAKELNDLKEKMEAQLEKEARLLQLQATSRYSQDSAIDTDTQEWETEILKIDLGVLGLNEDLGIELMGGADDPLYPNDNSVYISSLHKGTLAARKMRVNDCILKVNSFECQSISSRLLLETMRQLSTTGLNLTVRRRKPASPSRSLFTTQLQVNNYDHGISLETGIYISKITPGSLAAKDGNLDVGDRVLSINTTTVDNIKSSREAMLILHEPGDVLTITTMKSTYCAGNCGSGPNRDIYKKYINSTTQTDKTSYSRYQESYQKPQYVQSRRVMLDVPEKPLRNPSPINTSISERDQEDAIAELDSVIDAFRPHPAPTSTKHSSRHRKSKELDKNGGTWPKARSGPIIEHGTGTILHPRKNKERLPLSVLLNNPPSWSSQNNSKIDTSSIDFSVRSGKVGKDVMEYYAKKKTGKYTNSDTESNAGDSPATRPSSHMYGPPSTNAHNFFTPQYTRYSQPSPSHSGESMLYCFEPSYNHVSQFHHSHSPSVDMHYNRHTTRSPHRVMNNMGYRGEDMPESYHGYEVGTFPRKRENPRFRIPSNPSVASKSSGGAGGISTGSIDRSVSSERDSPMPTFRVEVLNPGQIAMPANKRQSLPEYGWASKYLKKPLLRGVGSGPLPGELRWISIEKSVEPLGIQISCVDSGGVFVSTVTEHSVASKVGLQVGDQLLEVCGINMRSATYQLAANVLRQCGNSITMLVQYSPDKYQELEGAESSTSSRSETPTPCNSPTVNRKSTGASVINHGMTTLTRRKSDRNTDRSLRAYEPRYFIMETRKCSNLGISLVGGNAVGIFVHSVTVNSLAYNAGLRTGDRILEYNGTDLREATAEEAAYELAKPAEKVTVLAQYLIDKYNEIKDKPGDSFFIRALFDRSIELGDVSSNSSQLQFRKDDVLYVDNTMYNGVPGNWRAWLVDHNGYKQQVGIIPSKYKVEEELANRRSGGELEGDARRATRRSFFRRKKHQRSNSKELASFSNINLGWYSSDSGTLHDDSLVIASYQRVIRLNSEPSIRPVIVVGPLADCVTDKLIVDFPDLFIRYIPEAKHCSQASMEKGVADSVYIDYRKKGTVYECVSVSGLKEACNKNCHCIIDIGLTSVERLHRHHIYPIVLLIKFKSTKQVKEAKDSRSSHDKISAKAAKEMYEHALKLESEYRHYISAVIPAGVNVAYMCTQIKAAVDLEQSKTLWVPSPTPL